MNGHGIRGYGFSPIDTVKQVRGMPAGRPSQSQSVIEVDPFAWDSKKIVVEDVDGHANLEVGFVRDHGGDTRLTIRNSGSDPEDYVEASVPLELENDTFRGRGALIQGKFGFSKVAVEVQQDKSIQIVARRRDEERTFVYRDGKVTEPALGAQFEVERLLAGAKDPIDITEGEDYWIIGDVEIPKND